MKKYKKTQLVRPMQSESNFCRAKDWMGHTFLNQREKKREGKIIIISVLFLSLSKGKKQ